VPIFAYVFRAVNSPVSADRSGQTTTMMNRGLRRTICVRKPVFRRARSRFSMRQGPYHLGERLKSLSDRPSRAAMRRFLRRRVSGRNGYQRRVHLGGRDLGDHALSHDVQELDLFALLWYEKFRCTSECERSQRLKEFAN
jgi:hypothetical protein